MKMKSSINEIVIQKILSKQPMCIECGNKSNLEIHHRIFRSEYTQEYMENFLAVRKTIYENTHKRYLAFVLPWGLHSMPNLAVLCNKCHGKIHSGDFKLRNKYRESFTDPATGFNVFYKRPEQGLF